MRLGRKLSEGFAVDHEADSAVPAPDTDRADEAGRAVPVAAEPDHFAGTGAPTVAAGQPPVS
jgi:hypothetical protein